MTKCSLALCHTDHGTMEKTGIIFVGTSTPHHNVQSIQCIQTCLKSQIVSQLAVVASGQWPCDQDKSLFSTYRAAVCFKCRKGARAFQTQTNHTTFGLTNAKASKLRLFR